MKTPTRPARKNRKPLFVLIIPRFEDLANAFYAGEVMKGASVAASRLDADILIHLTERGDHATWLGGDLLNPDAVDGILFADIDRDWDVVKSAIRAGVPTIVLNNPSDEPFNCIAIDNRRAACAGVTHLVAQGHRKIGHIAGDLDTQAGQDRLAGYYDALESAGIGRDKKLVKKGGFLRTPARQAAQALLKDNDRPTAIFAASDVMAFEVLDVAKTLGIKVPDELSVVGFDNNLTDGTQTRLATFEQPIVDMARAGIEGLYQMSLGLAKLPIKSLLEAKFIKGRTTATLK
ncbi:MAG: substrate-binding domain-containing protein [Candidatus Omnitrophica bacterium]|nr:substrate-binding domain-containing protein [Candidatus Omnitrophota bacterium]